MSRADASSYASWYHVNGLFFDEMASVPGFESYYSTLNAYSESLGFTFTVGNPGQDVPLSYMGTLDCLVIYENAGLPSTSNVPSVYSGYPKADFAVISYADSEPTTAQVQSITGDVGYVYFTDANLPNPYGALPSYFAAEGSMVAPSVTTSNSSATTTTTAGPTATSTATETTTTTITQLATTTVTSTATAYTTMTGTATATTTSTTTSTATATTTQTAGTTTTTTATATSTTTGTETDTATTTTTTTATATAFETETSTATVTTTSTVAAAGSGANAANAAPSPALSPAPSHPTQGILSSLTGFLAAKARVLSNAFVHAINAVGRELRFVSAPSTSSIVTRQLLDQKAFTSSA